MKSIKYPIILAIDTSCDDTSVAVTQGMKVLSNIIASQIEFHRKYGGVMPLVAKLEHHKLIHPTYQEAIKRAGIKESDIDAISVTYGPGLAIALEVGIEYAKQLAKDLNKPLIAVNHMSGHLFSSLAVNSKEKPEPTLSCSVNTKNDTTHPDLVGSTHRQPIIQLPALVVLASGGHTEIILVENNTSTSRPQLTTKKSSSPKAISYKLKTTKIAQTLDDAAGECLDKFARLLDLGYPGAPAMEQLAKKGDPHKYKFPLPMTESRDFNYSFSGLKTSGRHKIEELTKDMHLSKQQTYDLAASFQYAVIRHITHKLKKAIEKHQPKSIWIGGGVANNLQFRKAIRDLCKGDPVGPSIQFIFPHTKKLISDNAAMIGVAAYFQYQQKDFVEDFKKLQRKPRLSL